MNFQKFSKKTGIKKSDVSPLCQTPTNPENETPLVDWLAEGDYDGDETAESLAAEWDEVNSANR
jgi:hypothetical protein